MSSDGIAFVDEEFVPISEARIPLMDWGFLHSDATYDVAHVWKGHFFRLEDHLDRFTRNTGRLRMNPPHTRTEIRDILFECTRRSGLRDAYVELVCTRGLPKPGSRDPRSCTNRFYAFAVPFIWIADSAQQAQGLHASISNIERIPSTSVDPTVKNYHWLDLVSGLFEAYDKGGETVILCDRQGNIAEGPGFNVFAVVGNRLVTPKRGVLQGITRQTVLEMAAEAHIPVEQRDVPTAELRRANEVFATSTAGGIMPITRLDQAAIGDGTPGAITTRLRDTYWQWHDSSQHTTPVAYD